MHTEGSVFVAAGAGEASRSLHRGETVGKIRRRTVANRQVRCFFSFSLKLVQIVQHLESSDWALLRHKWFIKYHSEKNGLEFLCIFWKQHEK